MSEGRRSFLQRLGAIAAGAAIAPTAIRTLNVEPVETDLSKPDSEGGDRPRPRTRWIGHF